ncbi:MAG: SNF2-related protein [Psychrilyobacter sp.]|uniref:DEAD/DEAH box helicase n=1 Tax=Psychrilyobacter sp. TaxID=2586924 RepID=UPI003C74053A
MYNKFISKSEERVEVYFKLRFFEKKSYIEVVDKKGNEISLPMTPIQADKNTLEIISNLELINEYNYFNISWENEDNLIYLEENPHLFELLRKSKYFVTDDFKSVSIREKKRNITLKLEKSKGKIDVKLVLDGKYEIFEFLTENYVIRKHKIYHIEDMGENYLSALELNTQIELKEMERFLTITNSYFDNLNLEYEDYRVEKLNKKSFVPRIIIEKISKDRSLYLKFGFEISTMTYNMLKTDDIKTVVLLNSLEKVISICDIDISTMSESMEDVIKILVKYQRKLKLKESYYVEENLIILHEKLAKEFISKELLNLVSKYKFIGTEKLKTYKIKTVQPKLIAKLSHSIDFLEGDAHLEIEGEKFSILDIISKYKKDSYIVLSDGTNALINKKYIEKLERLFKNSKSPKDIKISFFDLPIIEELIGEKISGDGMTYGREIFEGLNEIENLDIPDAMVDATLRNYQEYGYKWLYYITENKLGGCLADDMGLGKTIQTISILAYTYLYKKLKKPSLIIMPKSLVFNWENEIKKFCNGLTVGVYYGNNRDFNEVKSKNIILTTYGTVRNDVKLLTKEKFEMIILDESQNIKNITSQITKAVMLLNSEKRLALSGTPVENNLGELYSLFRFLNPQMFGGIEDFNNYYANPIQKDNDLEIIEELKKKIYPFILRRIKKQVLKDLPDKIEKTLYVEMNEPQRKLYEERRNFYYTLINQKLTEHGIGKSQIFILQALNELRQIASCPESKSDGLVKSAKLEILVNNILEAVKNGHKVLVFTNYINSIENICRELKDHGINHISMTGATKNRQELVEKFQTDKECKVFIMTLKTGGVGLNLTAADKIFIYDPWWNKTAEDQAVDRSYRMGQDRTVFAYKLITKGTIEEKMLSLQMEKNKLFNSLITTDTVAVKSLSESDIEYMLGV